MSQAAAPSLPPAPPPAPPAAPIAPPLGGAVVRGSLWMLANTGLSRAASFLAQILLGWWLIEDDFGVYGVAISIAAITAALRDGGLRQLLIQRGGEWDTLAGPVFWLALALNTLAAALLAAAAPALGHGFGMPQLPILLYVIAASIPLGTPGAILSARLSVDLRFKPLGIMLTISGLIRQLGAVALAFAGMGPMSFVLPLIAVALFEWAFAYRADPTTLWRLPPRVRLWPGLIVLTWWVMLGTFATGLANSGAFAAIAAVVGDPAARAYVVGIYVFAFQIVVQVGVLLSTNLGQVLFPAMTKLIGEPERERQAILRSLRLLTLAAGPLCLVLVPTFAPLERLIWAGKWSESVRPVQVLAVCYPFVVMLTVPLAVQLAHGWFRAWGLLLLALGVGVVGAGAAGAVAGGTPLSVALWTGGYSVASGVVGAVLALRPVGVTARQTLAAMLPGWALSTAAAAAGLGAVRLLPPIGNGGGVADHLLALGVGGTAFGLVLLAGLRFAFTAQLNQLLHLVPAALRRPARRVLRLP